jgi:hypothetical protein
VSQGSKARLFAPGTNPVLGGPARGDHHCCRPAWPPGEQGLSRPGVSLVPWGPARRFSPVVPRGPSRPSRRAAGCHRPRVQAGHGSGSSSTRPSGCVIADPQRRDVWPEGRGVGGDLVDVVSAWADALDEAAQALDVRGFADRIALGIVHSQHDADSTGSPRGGQHPDDAAPLPAATRLIGRRPAATRPPTRTDGPSVAPRRAGGA